jgi:endonuclease V-like protein UPF0215 family
MKSEIRIVGIDDMPFSFDDAVTGIIGVVMRGGHYVEGVLRGSIKIDGADASHSITHMVSQSKYSDQLRVIMIDGGALGGFNVVDGECIFEATAIPVMTVTPNQPDSEALKSALKQHFEDWESRWSILQKGTIYEVVLDYTLYVKPFGLSIEEAKQIIKLTIVRGAIPEPLRLAHIIATGIKSDENYKGY